MRWGLGTYRGTGGVDNIGIRLGHGSGSVTVLDTSGLAARLLWVLEMGGWSFGFYGRLMMLSAFMT